MPTGFDQAFRRVKEPVADFRASEKFYLSPAYQEQEARHDGLDRCPSLAGVIDCQPSAIGLQHCCSDALVYDLYALTPAEIKIVEGAAK